jgi:tRNA-specific 2-thiouridylase
MPVSGCCTVADAEDARGAAARLGVPYYVLDYVDRFRTEVVDRFGETYLAGRTPNPCIECNRRVRFDALLERTTELGCDVLVTGHHARVRHEGGQYRLLRATDQSKDQSYVLHMLGQQALGRIRFPVGEMTKDDVRSHATRLGLRTASKPDSQDLCFVGDGDYRAFLRTHFPDTARPGPMVDESGTIVAEHDGVAGFTIGQRRGLGVAAGERRYVTGIDAATATVTIGPKNALLADTCRVSDVTFVAGEPPLGRDVAVKIRYRSAAVPARIEPDEDCWLVRFEDPQAGVAPGQAAVFYSDDEVLGGGTILATR